MTYWDWPQWIIALAILLNLCIHLAKNGQVRHYNAGYALADAVLFSWLLWMGKFW